MRTGLVFNVQRFSVHDGPGVRTTVFMKGCPLCCAWCHNPESQSPVPEFVRLRHLCMSCGRCTEDELDNPVVNDRDEDDVEACPTGALQGVGERVEPEALVTSLLRDRIFFDESGGGVTISGGEPLVQPAFVTEVLRLLRAEGVHTALDTCGFGRWPDLRDAAAHANLVLYDLKLMDPARHKAATGVSNEIILDNLRSLAGVHPAIWIRIPIIPGVNDDDANIEAAADFVRSVPGIRQVDLLPYHPTGEAKFARLGMDYRPARHAAARAGPARHPRGAVPRPGPHHDHRRTRMTARTERLRRASLDAIPSISGERAAITTAFYKEQMGRHSIPVLRAMNFYAICDAKTLWMGDGELIVGERGPRPKAVPTYPELTCHSAEDLRILDSRPKTQYKVDPAVIEEYEREIIPFWRGRSLRDQMFSELPQDWLDAYAAGCFTEFMEQRAPGHTVADGKLYRRGMLDFKADIAKTEAALDFERDPEALDKREQLRAMSIACDAVMRFAERHAELAEAEAARAQDDARRAELLKVAERLPMGPGPCAPRLSTRRCRCTGSATSP